MFNRIVLIVLDSVGVGALPDAVDYGDIGANTLKNLADRCGGLSLPNLEALGLGNIQEIKGVKSVNLPLASFGKMNEVSAGKDTITGHWEMMGIIQKKPFPTYPEGFPKEIIRKFEELTNSNVLGNKCGSGTDIIREFGDIHVKTKDLIVYTSADSVFQIAAHEDIFPLEKLYSVCQKAREFLKPPHNVGRVIARPFIGSNGNYIRTCNRKDFSLPPSEITVLDLLKAKGFSVDGVGKIYDIFSGSGITQSYRTKNNLEGVKRTLELLKNSNKQGLIFVNLIDFDMHYGHRNDLAGYKLALNEFDRKIPHLIKSLENDDLLIITADHGCDPTTIGTDHTREYVPILAYSKRVNRGVNLGIRNSFADMGATIFENFSLNGSVKGNSFLHSISN